MNLLQSTAVAGLFAASSILTGSSAQSAPIDPALLAEELVLPLGDPVAHFNEANQIAFTESCILEARKVRCTLDVKDNGALLSYKQVVDYMVGAGGVLSIKTFLGRERRWTPDIYSYDYKPMVEAAKIVEWDSESPLAHFAASDPERVIQNGAQTIALVNEETVDIYSSVPVNEFRGFDVHSVFNGVRERVESYVIPRVLSDHALLEVAPKDKAGREFTAGTYENDTTKLQRYIVNAKQNGGRYDFFIEP